MDSSHLSFDEAVSHLKGFVMPVQPELLSDLRTAFPDTELMADLLMEDPALCLSVLRLTASTDIENHSPHSIRNNIEALGAHKITAMINAVMLVMAKNNEFHSKVFTDYWEASKKLTGFISTITRQLNIPLVDEAECIGMLHNIGMPFLWQKHPDYFERVQAHPSECLTECENALFKCDHPTIGYYVAKGLHLCDSVCDVIRYHHMSGQFFNGQSRLDDNTMTLLALLKMVESIIDEHALIMQKTNRNEWEEIKRPALETLGLCDLDYADLSEML